MISIRDKIKKSYKYIYKTFKIGSIQSIIVYSFTAVTLIVMLMIGIAFYSTYSENSEKNASASMQQIVNQATINLENYFYSMIEVSDVIQKKMDTTTIDNIEILDDILELTLDLRADIVSVSFYSSSGNLLLTSPKYTPDSSYSVTTQNWFAETIAEPTAYIFEQPHVQRLFLDKRPWVTSLSHGINANVSSINQDLIIKVDMNFNTIDELCNQVVLGNRGYIYIIDNQGNIIYHPQQQLIYAGLKEENIEEALLKEEGSYIENYQGEKRIITIQSIEYANWKMVGVSFVNELVENRQNFNQLIIIILLFGVIFVAVASFFISFRISRPIIRLEHEMNRVERGDFNIDALELKGEDEVKELTKSFNIMISRIRQLMTQIVKEQEEKRKSELKVLQAQINPHFLYNTLDSIIWMNENKNYDGVTDMVSALAKLFRISLSRGAEIISIEDEIEHARSYLIIQKIRYKNKFDYTIEVDEEIKDNLTVKLIVQPIIENAIYHGVNNIAEKGLISIKAKKEENKIKIIITDNGYGIKKENLETILTSKPSKKSFSGVGLKNVNQRIKLRYGDIYGISIESEEDIGTIVTISIPIVNKEIT